MQYQEMIEVVQRRMPTAPAEALLTATVRALGEVTRDGEMRDVRSQLPGELKSLEPLQPEPGRSVDEFCARVAQLAESEPDQGRQLAGTGLAVLSAGLTSGQMEQLLASLPHGYAQLLPQGRQRV